MMRRMAILALSIFPVIICSISRATVYDSVTDSNASPISETAWALDGNPTAALRGLGTTTAQDLQIIRNSLPILYFGSYGASLIGDLGAGKQLRFNEATANGTNYIALRAPVSVASDTVFTLPSSASAGILTSDGSGNLSIGSVTSSAWGLFGNSLVGGEYIGSNNAFDWDLVRNSSTISRVVSDGIEMHQPFIRRDVASSSMTIQGGNSTLGAYTTWFGQLTPDSMTMRNKAAKYEFRDGSDAAWFSFETGGFFGDVVLKAPGGAAANFFRVIPQNLMSGVDIRGGTGSAAAVRVYGNSQASFPRQVHLLGDSVKFRNAADTADNAVVSDGLFRFNDSSGTERSHLDGTVFTSTVPFSSPQNTTGERYGLSSSVGSTGVAIGQTTVATGGGSTVVGYGSSSNGNSDNTIIGKGIAVTGTGTDKTLLGNDITVGNGNGTIGIGNGIAISPSSSGCVNCIVIGNNSAMDIGSTSSSSTIQIGPSSSIGSQVSVITGIAIGSFSAVGNVSGQGGSGAIAIGPSAESSQSRGIAFGRNAVASGTGGAQEGGAIGYGATTSHTNGWAIGRNATSIASSTLTFGSSSDPLSVVSYSDLAVSDGTTKTFRALPGQLFLSLPSAIVGDTYHVKWFERPANGTDFFGIRAADNMTASFSIILPTAGPTDDGEVMAFTASGVGSFVGPLWSTEGNSVTPPDNLLGTTNANDFTVIRNNLNIFNVTANGIQMNVTRIRTTGDDTSFILDGGDTATLNARITLNGRLNASPGTIFYRGSSHLFRNDSDVEQARIDASGIALGTTSFGSGSHVVAIKGTVTTPSAVAGQGIIYVTSSGALRYRGPTTDTLLANP